MIENVFYLPLPTSVNALHTLRKAGGKARSKPYQAWVKEAGYAILTQRFKPILGPYELMVHAVRPDKKRRDLGNLEKAVSDLLVAHGVVEDDHLCECIFLEWVRAIDGPGNIKVRVWSRKS